MSLNSNTRPPKQPLPLPRRPLFSLLCGLLFTVLSGVVLPTTANGQGWIVDQHQRPLPVVLSGYEIDATINHQIATVAVRSTFRNDGHAPAEGDYLFPLPSGATIGSFTLEIDGKPVAGEILDADRARDTYETIVRNMLDPALLEWADDGLFRARLFPIESGKSREITLKYDLVLPRDGDVARFIHPLTSQVTSRSTRPAPIPSRLGRPTARSTTTDVAPQISIQILSDADVRNVYSPSHDISVERTAESTDVVVREALNERTRSLVLYYSLSRDHLAATFIPYRAYGDRPGYFMLMLDPPVRSAQRTVQPRDIVFILDTSGSMAGEKLEQAKAAVTYSLQRLGPKDRFGVVSFSSDVGAFSGDLAGTGSVDDATYFVEQLEARGGTNINAALTEGLHMLDGSQAGTVVFLTDGLPSVGVAEPRDIINNAVVANKANARIFTFGVGYDVNTNLLDGVARAASAFAEYIAPEENIEERVSAFYDRIRYPVMTDVTIEVDGTPVTALTPGSATDLFLGDGLLITGRYKTPGDAVIRVSGTVVGDDGAQEIITQEVDVTFPDRIRDAEFVARVWAARRIGELLESIRLDGENPVLVEEVVALSKEFGIVTPYTSYLVTEDEATAMDALRRNGARGTGGAVVRSDAEPAEAMRASSGRTAVSLSRDLAALKQSRQVADQPTLANVQGQTFVMSETDTWNTQAASEGLDTWKVTFGSEAYFAFARAYPDAVPFLELGQNVQFVFNGQLVHVGPDGALSISDRDLRNRFGR